jgi:OOP family OmpA-OmpF porin
MNQKITIYFLLMMTSLSGFAQKLDGQWSVEGNYGAGFSGTPGLVNFGTYNVGLRYMKNEMWGFKVDFSGDKFRTDERIETGVDYMRASAQAVYNVGRALDWPAYTGGYVNALLHAGVGYSHFKSTVTTNDDNMGNVIIGFTPQIFISDRVAFQADASYIVNVRQHFDYDGFYRYDGAPKAFAGGQANITVGILIYIGKTGSDYDWR